MAAKDVNDPVIIRAARAEDVAQIAALIAPFVAHGKLLVRTYDELGELLPNFFVAVQHNPDGEDVILGCAALEIYSPKLAEVRSLAVSEKAQGLGIGKRLVNACVERARINHVFEVMAITSSDAFFQQLGFDYTLPGEKRALFITTRESADAPAGPDTSARSPQVRLRDA